MKIDVKTYAYGFEILCKGLIPLVALASVLLWFFGDNFTDSTYGLHLANFSFWQRSTMFLIDSIGVLLVIYALWLCIRIARHFQSGEIFTASTAMLFARVSKIAVWWGLYNIIEIIGFNLLFMPEYPKKVMILAIGASGLFYLFIIIFLSMLATLVAKASELQQDQDLTV
jgi:hypothetical protein